MYNACVDAGNKRTGGHNNIQRKLNESEKGKYLTVLALKQGANTTNPEFADIMWIDQTEIGKDLSYSITVPESLYTLQNRVITYDIGADNGKLIYVSSSGSSSGNGSETSPYSTLASAVNKANESGDTIVLLDTVTIPSNYTLQADKSVTITGMSPSSGEIVGGLDFTGTISTRFDLDVTFENMTFTTIPETDSNVNRIFACGRKMVMGKGLTMTNPIDLFGGNTSGKTINMIVKACTGDTFSEYVEKNRLELVKKIMVDSDEDIKIISQKCGYQNYDTFYKFFKKHMGVSPAKWRRAYKK